MSYRHFLLIIGCMIVLTWCLGTKTAQQESDNTPVITWTVEDSPSILTWDTSWAISEEEVDAILGEIFQAIEGWIATPERTGATEPLLESNDAMPQDNSQDTIPTPETMPQDMPQN
jgi:hypothetical protein